MLKRLKPFRYIIFIALTALFSGNVSIYGQYNTIQKYSAESGVKASGDEQWASAGERLQHPFIVAVTDTAGNPAPGVRVTFELTRVPFGSKGYQLERYEVFTNSQGIARTHLHLGDKEGEYQVSASIQTKGPQNFVIFTAYANARNWALMLFVGLLGGLAIFFIGINQMSIGLRHGVADKLRLILLRMSRNRVVATFFGALVTVITQSSSATTVMLVGFVQSGLLRFEQTIGMILGAAIGTTITVQLISFKLADYSLLVVALGFGIMVFVKKHVARSIGEALVGFGLLFYGMHLMSGSMTPLKHYEPFLRVIESVQQPIVGVLVGTLLTAIVQSSAAFIGIVLTMTTQGLISLEGSIPLLMGANLGTAVTGIIAAFAAGREAKKVAMAYAVFKFIGILLLFWLIEPFAQFVRFFTPDVVDTFAGGTVTNISRQVANAHTIYNVLLALLVLPFTNHFARLVDWVMPIFPEKRQRFKTQFIDVNLLRSPSIAIEVSRRELVGMAQLVNSMLADSINLFIQKDPGIIDTLHEKEEHVNFLRDKLNEYLLRISHADISDKEVDNVFRVMFATKELEQIGDIISKNLLEKGEWWLGAGLEFSDEGKNELIEFHKLTQKQLNRAIEILDTLNLDVARKQLRKYDHYKQVGIELERSHFDRLKQAVGKSIESSKTHLELVSLYRIIGSHANNIARIMIGEG
ncbi:MAG: Na/Pi symporter [Bacteroidota bacterium]